jgi:magnesium transporter
MILNQLESDDALNLIEDLDEDFQQQILKSLSKSMRAAIEEGLTFPEDSAGRLMQRSMIAVPQFWTVGKTIDFLRASKDIPDNFYDVIVVDPMHHVVGEVPVGRILRAARGTKIEDLALENAHAVRASVDQEEVAFLFRREGLVSAPVINDDNRLIGVITVDDIVDVIDEEAEEDFLKIGGIANIDIYRPVWDTTKSRFFWLCLNMLTAIAASIVIGLFEATLERVVALAILMPIVASMGGNAGTQALTVAVRALATKDLSSTNAWRIIGKEALVGTLNGVSFAMISGVVAWLWFDDILLGLVIGFAMVINLMVAGLSGASIPIILDRYGLDPALSSSIFLTTITDIIGFFAFLGLAALVLL